MSLGRKVQYLDEAQNELRREKSLTPWRAQDKLRKGSLTLPDEFRRESLATLDSLDIQSGVKCFDWSLSAWSLGQPS